MIGNISVAYNSIDLNNLLQLRQKCIADISEYYRANNMKNEITKTKIVVINDVNNLNDEYIVGSILLPDSRAMFALIEGDYNNFSRMYFERLDNDPDIREYLVVLLAGLIERNFSYIFYFDNDDPNIVYPISNALFSYLKMRFGIYMYTPEMLFNNEFLLISQGIDQSYLPQDQNLINQYKLSNRPKSLFYHF